MNRNNTLNNLAPILLVEDNPAHTELILRGLEAGRVTNRVIHVTDGKQALGGCPRIGTVARGSHFEASFSII